MDTLIVAGIITIWLLVFIPMAVVPFLDNRRTPDRTTEERSEANLTISQYDAYTDTLLMAAEGSAMLSPEAFQIDGLESAALTTAIEVVDSVSGSSFVVDVTLTWQGAGDPLRHRDRLHITTRAFSIRFRFDGNGRQTAAAMVTDGTMTFTPEPAIEAGHLAIRSGSDRIVRN